MLTAMTQVQNDLSTKSPSSVPTNLRRAGIGQLAFGLLIFSAIITPSLFGTPLPVVSVVCGALGLFTILNGVVALFLARRYPNIRGYAWAANGSLVGMSISGNGGALAIILLIQPLVLGIMIGIVIVFLTFSAGLLAVSNRRSIAAVRAGEIES